MEQMNKLNIARHKFIAKDSTFIASKSTCIYQMTPPS